MIGFKRCLFVAYLALAGVSVAEENSTNEASKRGEPFKKNEYSAGYNLPASILVNNPINLDITASYLYYHVSEEGLELASSATVVQLPNFSYAAVISDNQQLATQNFKYNSGFQVGIGGKIDNWDIGFEYSWIRSRTKTYLATPTASFGSPVWISHNWFQSLSTNNTPLAATQLEADWHIKMHLVDFLASRPCYESSHLIVKPFGGLRGAFIYQQLNIDFTEAPNVVAVLPAQPIQSLNSSKYWGIGPKFGVESYVLLPKKFRIEGNIAWSLLYSRFSVNHAEDASSVNQKLSTIDFSIHKNYLRDMLEMGLGLGWGSYVGDNDGYHVDFAASFDFMKFSGQNMMRRALDGFITQVGGPGSDIYVYGLNIKASFDF